MSEECNFYFNEGKMINRVSYKLRRTLPGQQFDYEELYAEDTASDVDPRTPMEMMKGVIELCVNNTARARVTKKEEIKEKK